MSELGRGRVAANGITFEYLEAGEGPLALRMHGFPDSPFTDRYLLPELARAGFHAVAPFVRGFAPTELPIVVEPCDPADLRALLRPSHSPQP